MTCENRQLIEMTVEELQAALEFHLGSPTVVQHPASTRVEQKPWGPVMIVETVTDVDMSNLMRISRLRQELEKRYLLDTLT